MKSTLAATLTAVALLCGTASTSLAQEAPSDPLNKFIFEMFQMHHGKTLCVDASTSLNAVRKTLTDHMQAKVAETATPQAVATAMWQLFPCPFSPLRAELRPAKADDIVGSWLFPEGSQKLRRGPRLNQASPTRPLRVKCDAVGYFPNGELRHAVVAGVPKCPFEASADLDVARKNPRVSSWAMLREGRLGVTRTDVVGHIEEWDVFAVAAPFTFDEVRFAAGDLVAYVRRENGNEIGAATQFRHLQRLP